MFCHIFLKNFVKIKLRAVCHDNVCYFRLDVFSKISKNIEKKLVVLCGDVESN